MAKRPRPGEDELPVSYRNSRAASSSATSPSTDQIDTDFVDTPDEQQLREALRKRVQLIAQLRAHRDALLDQAAGFKIAEYSLRGPAEPEAPLSLPLRDRVEAFGVTPDGRVLAGRYVKNRTLGTFGGGIEPGEDPVEAAIREYKEEAGYTLRDAKLLPIDPVKFLWSEKIRKSKPDRRHFGGSRTHYVVGRLDPEEQAQPIDTSGLSHVRFRSLRRAINALRAQADSHEDEQQRRLLAAKLKALELIAPEGHPRKKTAAPSATMAAATLGDGMSFAEFAIRPPVPMDSPQNIRLRKLSRVLGV